MAELTLEPYSLKQRWQRKSGSGHWARILSEYLESLAQACAQHENSLIGHIKALALFAEGGCLSISVVAPGIPASTRGKDPECPALDLTLNVIVYGLPRSLLEEITRQAAFFTAQKWGLEVKNISS